MEKSKRKKQMKWNKGIVKTSILRIVVLMMIIGLNWSGISAIGQTLAYFNDTEVSDNTSITVGSLNFSLSSDGDFFPLVLPSQSASRDIAIIKEIGSMDFQYNAYAIKTGGNDTFCNALELEAKLDGVVKYPYNADKSLLGFNLESSVEFSDSDDWQFTAELTSDDPALQNQTCSFDFVFDGVQIGCVGFSDQEIISNTVASGQWLKVLISKVYYDVDNEHGTESKNEWIELYNPTDAPIDISNWKICDNTSCNTIPVSNFISGDGFAIITAQDTTWDYWNIPSGVKKIVLGNDIGNGLSDDGDRLILKNDNGYEIDAMSYGTDTSVFDLSHLGVGEGYMFARVPVWQDTNMADDWEKLSLPSITGINVGPLQDEHCGCCNDECGLEDDCPTSWHCAPGIYYSQQSTINWTATTDNISGDSGLSIDITYITDNDCSGDISGGDSSYTLASGIANTDTGSYVWDGWETSEEYWDDGVRWKYKKSDGNIDTVPYFYGLTWIEITATGPENFMVNDSGLSIPMFEPLPPGGDLNAVACPFELPAEDGTEEIEEPIDADEEIFDDTIEREDIIIDLPDIVDPIDTVTPSQDGVDIVDEEDQGTVEVKPQPPQVVEEETVEEEITGEEIPEEITEVVEAALEEGEPRPEDSGREQVVEEPELIIEPIKEEIVEEIIAVIEAPATVPDDAIVDDTEENPEAGDDIQE